MRDDNQMLFQTEITNFYFSYTCLLFHMLFFFLNKFIYFIYLFLAVLGLRCCAWASLHCSALASNCGGFSLQSTGSRRSGFSSCGTQAQ